MNGTIETVWALACLAVVVTLAAGSRRIGRARAAAWLVVVGLLLLSIEEPALTVWLGLTGPRSDPDGIATLVTPMARAHMLDAAIFGTAAAVLLGRIALTAFKSGQRWAWRVLAWGLAITTLTEATTTVLVFSRGLPTPGPAGRAGKDAFGWQALAVGVAAWAIGLWLTRRPLTPLPTPPRAGAVPAGEAITRTAQQS